MKKSLLLLGYAREGSIRMKNKMIRSFGDTTLYDIYLHKLENIYNSNSPFSDVAIAISKSDKTIYKKTKNTCINIYYRDDISLNQGANFNCRDLFNYLKDTNYEYVMWINGCFPFLKEETIINIGRYFIENEFNGLHCIKRKYNWFWSDNKPININMKSLGTQTTKSIYESVQCTHIFNRKYLLENNIFWPFKENDPYLFEIEDDIEFLDVDSSPDFEICEAIYAKRNKIS